MRSALILFGLNKPGPFLREPFKTIEVRASGQVIILITGSLAANQLQRVKPRSGAIN
jgi:hypothetical protein